MQTIKNLLSVSILAGASASYSADYYSVTGAQIAGNIPVVTLTHFSCAAGSTLACLNPVVAIGPTFTSGGAGWTIDTATPTLYGSLVFDAFRSHFDVLSGELVADTFYPRNLLTISGAASYSAATRTLSIANAAFATTGSTPQLCVGAKIICNSFPSLAPITGDISLTFDDDTLTSFTGIAHTSQETAPGIATTTLTFRSAPTVPVPAAAWLFGSALFGVAGLRRRKISI